LMFEGGRETLAQTKDPLYATLGEYEAQLWAKSTNFCLFG
jgi:hypothetical protein